MFTGDVRTGSLAKLLACLPEGKPTRISVALRGGDAGTAVWDEVVDVFDEREGFVTEGSMTIGELHQRYGTGDFRVSAYSLREQRLLWEHYATIWPANNATEPG